MVIVILLAALLCILLTADLMLTALLFVRLCVPDEQERQERTVERALRRDPMDEGFENIMTFSVKGRTGFEGLHTDEE